jgi:hypothetical protein
MGKVFLGIGRGFLGRHALNKSGCSAKDIGSRIGFTGLVGGDLVLLEGAGF